MHLGFDFDATQVNPEQGASKLPVGRHPVIISGGEIKPTQSNDGGYLALNLQIIDGPNKGASGVHRLNLFNKSQQAVQIAQSQLSAICHAVGVYRVSDASVLCNLPFIIDVGLQDGAEAQAKGYTEVKKIFDINGNEPGKQPQQAQSQPTFGQQAQQSAGNAFQQPQQQVQQQPQGGAAPAWGGSTPAQQNQQPQQNAQPQQAAWGANAQPQQQAQQPAAGGWQGAQQNAQPQGGAAPAWAK
jgi:hypothetical protein